MFSESDPLHAFLERLCADLGLSFLKPKVYELAGGEEVELVLQHRILVDKRRLLAGGKKACEDWLREVFLSMEASILKSPLVEAKLGDAESKLFTAKKELERIWRYKNFVDVAKELIKAAREP